MVQVSARLRSLRPAVVTALATSILGSLALADAATTGRYKGKLKDGGAVSFQVSGNAVKRFQAGVTVSCVSAAPARSGTEIYTVAPSGSGKLSSRRQFTLKLSLPKQILTDPSTGKILDTVYSVKATVNGKVTGSRASGDVKVSYNKFWTAYNPSTGLYQLTLAACFSGKVPITWSAKRG